MLASPNVCSSPHVHKHDEPDTPTASTMTFQGTGACGDHLCQKKECSECVDDRFKPLLEFEFLDMLDSEMLCRLSKLGWAPEKGSPAEYVDEYGDSLLHSAARNGEIQVMKQLIDMNAQVNVCCEGECCCTPLMVACRWCHPSCACLLLKHGAQMNEVNSNGETAFDMVANRAMGSEEDKDAVLALLREKRA